jgi:BA14K-like protein
MNLKYFGYFAVAVVVISGVALEMDVLVEPAHKVEYAKTPPVPTFLPAPAQTDAMASPQLPAPVAIKPGATMSNKCDVTACAAAYQTFRGSDCTYLSGEGTRQLCTKGVLSDQATAQAVLNARPETSGSSAAAPNCNVAACSAAYHSFTMADCTYQPTNGPRQLCKK